MERGDKLGYVDGRHYTEHVETVKQLKRDGRLDDAIALLLRLVDATEAEDSVEGWGVAPGYYQRLAIIYRKQGDLDGERAILTRFARQRHAPGVTPAKLLKRLNSLPEAPASDPGKGERRASANEYIIYGPGDGPHWESMQVMEDHHWDMKDRRLQNSGECPDGHRDGVIPVPADLPERREGHGDWWCTEHKIQFGRRKP